MKRGEIWTLAGEPDYAGKPRPAVIVQDDRYDATKSITVVILTTVNADAPISRPLVHPTAVNGLRAPSYLMIDKVTTVGKRKIGKQIGVLGKEDIASLNQGLTVFLGMAY